MVDIFFFFLLAPPICYGALARWSIPNKRKKETLEKL
jgi:hypothetical protein